MLIVVLVAIIVPVQIVVPLIIVVPLPIVLPDPVIVVVLVAHMSVELFVCVCVSKTTLHLPLQKTQSLLFLHS